MPKEKELFRDNSERHRDYSQMISCRELRFFSVKVQILMKWLSTEMVLYVILNTKNKNEFYTGFCQL